LDGVGYGWSPPGWPLRKLEFQLATAESGALQLLTTDRPRLRFFTAGGKSRLPRQTVEEGFRALDQLGVRDLGR
jgi:hypothetical protein